MPDVPADFLQLAGKQMLVFGVANRKSVAYHIGQTLSEAGAEVAYVVRSEERRQSVSRLLGDAEIHVCDVERQEEIDRLRQEVGRRREVVHGLAHCIAFADYGAGVKPFHETPRAAFLRTIDVSCFSLVALANAFQDLLAPTPA